MTITRWHRFRAWLTRAPVVCAYCVPQRVICAGGWFAGGAVSHGICPGCTAKFHATLERLEADARKPVVY